MDLNIKKEAPNQTAKKIMAEEIFEEMDLRLKNMYNIKEVRINQGTIIIIKLYENTNFIKIRNKIISILNKMNRFDLVDVRYDQLFKLYVIDFKF